jgi:DNA oxidative demethylase
MAQPLTRTMPSPHRDLFDQQALPAVDGLFCLRGHAQSQPLLAHIESITRAAPLRHMMVPGGGQMDVAMSNCGPLGWVADECGYRYTCTDPVSARPWPSMPESFLDLARTAAAEASFARFEPDACLINRYAQGAGLGVHRDHDEADVGHPIVSVSIGASAVFLWGGLRRRDPLRRLPVHDGDVLVWGGASRLTYHGVMPLKPDAQGALRFNLTFRRAS